MIQAEMAVTSSSSAYAMRVVVLLRVAGHPRQHRLHAADPQQHTACAASHIIHIG